MSKAKFDAARELIQQKKYTEARSLLATINHPTARQWEAKLNALDTGYQTPPKGKRTSRVTLFVLIAVLIVAAVIIAMQVQNFQTGRAAASTNMAVGLDALSTRSSAYGSLSVYCSSALGHPEAECDTWADAAVKAHPDAAIGCVTAIDWIYDVNGKERFRTCLASGHIDLP